jgi:8-oxo-dGTP pyrophosphatase MutT (NUDIX family)
MNTRSRPRLTVAAVIQKDDQFLFVEERDSRGRLVINQPAGHVEAGESLIEAFARETFEETGWVVEPRAFLGAYIWGAPDQDISYLRVAILGEAIRHDPDALLDQGIERVLWLSREALLARQHQHRSDLVLRCTDDALKGEQYPLAALKSLL